ncbi:glycosyltransferase family 2 protein [Candidatus Frankia alpina]|uniref:Glycosyltransferase n=1 Tax=Candidatus Frankia alpina TaxID=2699483 RepID=A0A4S5ERP4_9ACTN|nr:glycosyltransferase [Candidatus Frankia alpina]THJ75104.1 glycosyltransferase [Candidatus Frankia alpina]
MTDSRQPWQRSRPVPTFCGAVELGDPVLPTGLVVRDGGEPYSQIRLLVRLHTEPLGYVNLQLTDGILNHDEFFETAHLAFADRMAVHLRGDGLRMVPALGPGAIPPREQVAHCSRAVVDPTSVTVVVCTRNRSAMLPACLSGLQALDHPDLEVVIVDNAPSDDSTRAVFDRLVGSSPRFRYVREDRPGLSCARNRGVAEARGEVIAFTDDDVRVDGGWIAGLLRGFRQGAGVGCVTGLVSTATLENLAEYYFDSRVTWASSCQPHLYDMDRHRLAHPLYPYSAGVFGAGANFAVRADMIRELGGFDEALGAGTLTEGGEDLDAFVRVLLGGYQLAYEPAALVWHSHRSDLDALRKQMWGYGTGLTAYLVKHLGDRRSRTDILTRLPVGMWKIWKIGDTTRESYGREHAMPRGLLARERVGMVAGPILYAQARAAAQRSGGVDAGS